MKLITAIIRPETLNGVLEALVKIRVTDFTLARVRSHGGEKMELVERVRLEIDVNDDFVEPTIDAILGAARTTEAGDGKIFVNTLERRIRFRPKPS